VVKCPRCESEFNYFSSKDRPFCSEKCKNIDLGGWLSEEYSLASREPLSETDIEIIIRETNSDDNQ